MIVSVYTGPVVPLEIFMGRKFGMGFFGGEILVQGIFCVLFEAQDIFLGFDFWS